MVSDSESICVGCRRVHGTSAGPRKGARVARIILDTINPSVDASGLIRCCRHGGVSLSECCSVRGEGARERKAGPWIKQ